MTTSGGARPCSGCRDAVRYAANACRFARTVLLAGATTGCPRFESPAAETTSDSAASEDTGSIEFCGDVQLSPGFVCVPEGPYTYGCASACDVLPPAVLGEQPAPHYEVAREVRLSSFQIMRDEVTASAYAACFAEGSCPMPSCTDFFGTWPMTETDGERPITCVTVEGAAAFCEWHGGSLGVEWGRLPTECEWEKAARGDTDARPYPNGDVAPLCDDAIVGGLGAPPPCVGKAGPAEVGSRERDVSPFGVRDMLGNVSELTSSRFGPENSGPQVRRGGAWHIDPFVDPASTRLDLRRAVVEESPPFPSSIVGFRCVVGATAAEATAECAATERARRSDQSVRSSRPRRQQKEARRRR